MTLLTERRLHQPWGLEGGTAGRKGINSFNGTVIPGKIALKVDSGDCLTIETAGGGGYGQP